MRIDQLKPGQVLYSVERHRMGNTMCKSTSVYKVVIASVAHDHVRASWNGSLTCAYYAIPGHWKAKKPVLIKSGWADRLATKAEREAGTLRDCGLFFRIG